MMEYAIFKTKWGYFGLAGEEGVVQGACLPCPDRQAARRELLRGIDLARDGLRRDDRFAADVQERIVAYFEGEPVDFSTDPAIYLDGLGPFRQKVLAACRRIGFGGMSTYGQLAGRIGYPGAARAVGGALARNPVPLIIPCHRVLRTDGGLGGFSAPGGVATKQRLLRHERSCLSAGTSRARPSTTDSERQAPTRRWEAGRGSGLAGTA
jgi:methylated-DNA-[protein]-cysteine S-methyltransferase